MALVLAPGRAAKYLAVASLFATSLSADPLSKKADVDFYHSVASRDLRGLATRSDGRIVAGPAFTELAGPNPAELLWCLEPTSGGRWLLGTGPEGRIFEVNVDPAKARFDLHQVAQLADSQVFALKRLPDGSILAGTSPKGGIVLVRGGQVQARVGLPADSVFDIALISGGEALVATGNPGNIYRVDLGKFSAAGVAPDKLSDPAALEAHGITLFGSVRDRNVRRIVLLSDGRIAAGSAPRGNVYLFQKEGGGPLILQENRDAEVTDLMPEASGGFLAAIVYTSGDSRGTDKGKDSADVPPPAQQEKFAGRSVLVRFPSDGFPETLTARAGAAFYGLARQGDTILLTGGEQGDFTGYDLSTKLALTFAGSTSARLSAVAPVPGAARRFLVIRNNAPGLAWVDFAADGQREAATGQIDLGSPGRLGALRFERLRDIQESQMSVEIKTSSGTDELEGWSPWTPLSSSGDGWRAAMLRGRYVKLRLRMTGAPATAEVDRASLYFLPQNRPPQLQDFHFLSPNYSIVPAADQPPPVISTLSQLLQPKDDDKRKSSILSSQVVPSPGTQAAFWTVTDPDNDNIVCTFSIRRDGESAWTDLAVDSRDPYVQFDTLHLPDGVYFTRLVAKETAPRPNAERLSAIFETDHLLVDHTPPDILEASVRRTPDALVVSVRGRDALSLLDGIEVNFNNGEHEVVEQPADGIRDGREETFAVEVPLARTAGATALDVTLYDSAGNARTRHLELPKP